MERLTYITDEEKKKCRKVADAFAELYELTDVMVVDAGRFGFVRLQWFNEDEGFDSAIKNPCTARNAQGFPSLYFNTVFNITFIIPSYITFFIPLCIMYPQGLSPWFNQLTVN